MTIRPDNVKGEIALELDVARLSTGDFLRAAEAFIGLVREISKTTEGPVPSDAWSVSVSEGSQIINVYPNENKVSDRFAHQVAKSVLNGLAQIESEAENPFGDNERAIEHIKTLGRIATRDRDSVPIRCLSRDAAKAFTKNVYNHASEILSWQYEDSGTVDGVLDVVSAHNGLEFRISEILHGKTVKCVVDEPLIDQALKSFRKRIEVVGLVSYSKQGFPKVVKATEIIQFPAPGDTPHFSKLRGILAGG